jgi:hypothetical protein
MRASVMQQLVGRNTKETALRLQAEKLQQFARHN